MKAIDTIHKAEIIHGDLKLENIMLQANNDIT
jgi:tRNA A-37 threonylcarbamoyl transferase component Bud32